MSNSAFFDEIEDGSQFENLVCSVFEALAKEPENQIKNVSPLRSGKGPDGGIDILLSMTFSDVIETFERKWVIQCKFRERAVSPSEIKEVNIPSLIHSYGAVGYFLVCKTEPTAGLTNLFKRLNDQCQFGYRYICWTGDKLKREILLLSEDTILKQYFPLHWRSLKELEG